MMKEECPCVRAGVTPKGGAFWDGFLVCTPGAALSNPGMKTTVFIWLVSGVLSMAWAHSHGGHGHGHGKAGKGKVVSTVVRTGNGAHVFETVPNWGALPDNKNVGPTHGGVAVSKDGHVFVSTEAAHGIVVFKKNGSFVKTMAPDCAAVHSLTIVEENGREFLYGAHLGKQRVVKLDLDGKVVLEIPNANTGEISGGLKGVTGVAVGPEGSIYAACGYGSNLIHKFDATGKLVKSAGGRGKPSENKFQTCHGISLDLRQKDRPLLLVCDRENRRLVHLDLELNWVGVHATHLRRPCAVSILGSECAVAELEGRVTILAQSGAPVAFLGDNPNRRQWAKKPVPENELTDGFFTSPHGLSHDADGNLYVQDWNVTGRVTKLKKTAP